MKTYSSRPAPEEERLYVHCDLCGGTSLQSYSSVNDSRFWRCRNCGLIFQNPQPTQSALNLRYSREYFSYEIENEESFFRLMVLGLKDVHFSSLEKRISCKRILDVGCATGKLLEWLRDRGWEVQGVEVCPASARYGIERRQLPIYIGTLEGAEFTPNRYSVVHASHLVEHLPTPSLFFREANRLLVPGGNLIVTTPNIAGFQSRLFREKWRSLIEDHITLFSTKTLPEYGRKYGFSLERLQTWGGLAAGSAPPSIKTIADRLVKRIGWGDVMIARFKKADQENSLSRVKK